MSKIYIVESISDDAYVSSKCAFTSHDIAVNYATENTTVGEWSDSFYINELDLDNYRDNSVLVKGTCYKVVMYRNGDVLYVTKEDRKENDNVFDFSVVGNRVVLVAYTLAFSVRGAIKKVNKMRNKLLEDNMFNILVLDCTREGSNYLYIEDTIPNRLIGSEEIKKYLL